MGRLEHQPGRWLITAEPHVAMRLKRYFAKIGHQMGTLKLSDTLENSREIRWWCERFPLEMTPEIRALLDARAEEHFQQEMSIHALITGRAQGDVVLETRIPLRGYQKVPAAIVHKVGRLLIADDLGLGKSAELIAILCDSRALPAVVVTQTHLVKQFAAELARFLPNLKSHILRKGSPYPLTKGPRGRVEMLPQVIITSYSKIAGWAETLVTTYGVRSILLDEAQEVRRTDSAKYAAAKHIADHCQFRAAATATPVLNYGDEIFAILEVVAAGALGSREEFLREWAEPVGSHGSYRIRDPKAFGSFIREQGLMIRRTKADVGRELPPLTTILQVVEADEEALDRVSAPTAELAKIILQQGESRKGAKRDAAEELANMLRQATGIAKAPYVAAFVRMLVEQGDRVVLFGWHREVYSIWEDLLHDLAPSFYTGAESPRQKEEAKRRFVEGETDVLIMSLRSGAGLDGLQGSCRTVVFGELDWAHGIHEQAMGRVHRDGQKEPVFAYYLVAETGADPVMADTLELKRHQVEGIRDPKQKLAQAMQRDPDRIKRLAEDWLKQRGKQVPRWKAAEPYPPPGSVVRPAPALVEEVREEPPPPPPPEPAPAKGAQFSLFGARR